MILSAVRYDRSNLPLDCCQSRSVPGDIRPRQFRSLSTSSASCGAYVDVVCTTRPSALCAIVSASHCVRGQLKSRPVRPTGFGELNVRDWIARSRPGRWMTPWASQNFMLTSDFAEPSKQNGEDGGDVVPTQLQDERQIRRR